MVKKKSNDGQDSYVKFICRKYHLYSGKQKNIIYLYARALENQS